ncbi:MAG: DUF2442 domain-containing protein [Verrucomicrobiota bacterium]
MNSADVEKHDYIEVPDDADAPDVRTVRFEGELMIWEMIDGRLATAPLTHWPTLWLATREERETFQIARYSVYWPLLDTDIASDHILRGYKEHRNFAHKAWDRWMARHYTANQAA